jgi:hypothetical protein
VQRISLAVFYASYIVITYFGALLHSLAENRAGKGNEVSPPAPTTSGKFFTSPYVSPKSSIDELLEYLGDHRTRHKVASGSRFQL